MGNAQEGQGGKKRQTNTELDHGLSIQNPV
jgi:hypothetical protein